jgi:hypothetical protein
MGQTVKRKCGIHNGAKGGSFSLAVGLAPRSSDIYVLLGSMEETKITHSESKG